MQDQTQKLDRPFHGIGGWTLEDYSSWEERDVSNAKLIYYHAETREVRVVRESWRANPPWPLPKTPYAVDVSIRTGSRRDFE